MLLLSMKGAAQWLLPPLTAFLATVLLTRLLIRVAPSRGWVSHPRQDRWNSRVVAHFGGIPILLAYSAAALVFFPHRQNLMLLSLVWFMALVGLADDVLGLKPRAKLISQIVIAALAVYAGIVHPLTAHLWLNAVFTLFWIVGITNAVNLLDNMDGLAAGIALIASAQVILLAGPTNPTSGLALCMLAACSGFLVFNGNPARIFMGDVGALSIGFFLACASVKTSEHLSSLGSVLCVPVLVLFIPVFDTLLVSVTRRLNGRRISLGARDHASHRLVMIGLNERQAVWILYVIASTAGVMAFLWKSSWGNLGAGLVALFLIGSILFWVYLAKLRLPDTWLSVPHDDELFLIPRILQQVVFKISAILLDAAVIVVGLYLAYVFKFEKLDEALLGRFLFAAALALAIKLPLLVLFGVYERPWSITERREIYPVLKATVLAACLLTAVSVSLPLTKTIESSIILIDAAGTGLLLVLCRMSGRIFDDILGAPGLLNEAVKRIVGWASVRPAGRSGQNGADELPIVPNEIQGEPEEERRPN
jgi:UDP-GlcNAc:undecaprenyl-phosphate GlcNAc-1-phosphate transferase